jgi:hypothetical protein
MLWALSPQRCLNFNVMVQMEYDVWLNSRFPTKVLDDPPLTRFDIALIPGIRVSTKSYPAIPCVV